MKISFAPHVAWSRCGGHCIVLDCESGSYFRAESDAFDILDSIEKGSLLDELVKSSSAVSEEVEQFVEYLKANNLVVVE